VGLDATFLLKRHMLRVEEPPAGDEEEGPGPAEVVVELGLELEPEVAAASLATGGPGKVYGADVSNT
jgi:hypothetical protein